MLSRWASMRRRTSFIDGIYRSPLLSFTRASNAYSWDSTGTLTVSAANTPRYDYDPTTFVYQNLIFPSNDFTGWVGNAAFGTSDGRLIESTGSYNHYIYKSVSCAAGVPQVHSVKVKALPSGSKRYFAFVADGSLFAGTPQASFDPTSGSVVYALNCSTSATLQSDGYWLVSITITPTSSGTTQIQLRLLTESTKSNALSTYSGTGTDGLYIKEAQVNNGSTLLPYYETTTAPYTQCAANGWLYESQSTNYIRNPRLEGAVVGVVGAGGTVPTNYAVTTVAGVTAEIVDTTSENGIPAVAVKWSGTASANGNLNFRFEDATSIAALTGQTWTFSPFVKLAGGSTSGINAFNLAIDENTSAGVYVTGGVQSIAAPTGAALASQRQSYTRTLSGGATVGAIRPFFNMPVTSGAVINITLRFAAGNCEQRAAASSPILPPVGSPAAATRAADVDLVSSLGAWFNASTGTMISVAATVAKTADNKRVWSFNDGTAANDISTHFGSNSGGIFATNISAGGVFQYGPSEGAYNGNTFYRRALAFEAGNPQAVTSGVLGGTAGASTTVLPSGLNRLDIGHRLGTQQLEGWIKQLWYEGRRMSNAELQAVTQ